MFGEINTHKKVNSVEKNIKFIGYFAPASSNHTKPQQGDKDIRRSGSPVYFPWHSEVDSCQVIGVGLQGKKDTKIHVQV